MSSIVLFFKQKTAYEMRISDWSSDVCSSDLGQNPENSRTALADAFQDMIEWGVRNGASDMHLNVRFDGPESEVRYTVCGRYVAPERFHRMPTTTLMDILAVAWKIGRASCRERVCQSV